MTIKIIFSIFFKLEATYEPFCNILPGLTRKQIFINLNKLEKLFALFRYFNNLRQILTLNVYRTKQNSDKQCLIFLYNNKNCIKLHL